LEKAIQYRDKIIKKDRLMHVEDIPIIFLTAFADEDKIKRAKLPVELGSV